MGRAAGKPRRRWRRILLILAFLFALFNVWAFIQARSMLTYVDDGTRTPPPEQLGIWDKCRVLLTGVRIPKPVNRRTPRAVDLAFETVHIRARDGSSLELWHLPRRAARATALMFHGYGDSKAGVLDAGRLLQKLGCEVWMVDFRGSGGSDGHATTLGIREAEDVRSACDYVCGLGNSGPVVLFGASMGGAAILRAVDKLGVVADGLILESVFDEMLRTTRNRFASMGLPSFPAAEALVFWGGVLSGANGFLNNPADYAHAARMPALVMQGADDQRVTGAGATNLYNALAGSKELVFFPGAKHESLATRDPSRWETTVGAWLNRVVNRAFDERPR